MKFAHFSDVHIGGWKEEKLNIMSTESFRRGINKCIEENVAFVLIAGDLFNTALPNIDLTNVMKTERTEDSLKLKFTTDKTGVRLTGLYGKAKGLERLDYDILDKTNLETEEGFKIFLFHHIINEYKPKGMEMVEGIDLNKFPKNILDRIIVSIQCPDSQKKEICIFFDKLSVKYELRNFFDEFNRYLINLIMFSPSL